MSVRDTTGSCPDEVMAFELPFLHCDKTATLLDLVYVLTIWKSQI